jgi:hypothetical protein
MAASRALLMSWMVTSGWRMTTACLPRIGGPVADPARRRYLVGKPTIPCGGRAPLNSRSSLD